MPHRKKRKPGASGRRTPAFKFSVTKKPAKKKTRRGGSKAAKTAERNRRAKLKLSAEKTTRKPVVKKPTVKKTVVKKPVVKRATVLKKKPRKFR